MIHIIYDVDDVLNNLTDCMVSTLGVKPNRYYKIEQNDYYTPDDIRRIFEFYRDPMAFERLDFVPGSEAIFDIERTGKARVSIMSCNLNAAIAFVKMRRLLESIPGATPQNIHMQIARGEDKTVDTSADIIVEDCLANCLRYHQHTLKILINKTYNQADVYNVDEKAENIIRVDNLLEANQLIHKIVTEGSF